jgi:lipid A disaccharide synthetase
MIKKQEALNQALSVDANDRIVTILLGKRSHESLGQI